MSLDERTITGDWDYSTLPASVHLGSDCWLERRDSFDRYRSARNPGLKLGNRVQVFTWTTFNIEPTGVVEVGDDSVLVGGIFMCADRVSIGRRVVVSYHVTISDSDFHPADPQLRVQDAIANGPYGDRKNRPPVSTSPVQIDDDVWIGIGAIILKGVHIGAGARIGTGAVVTRNIAPRQLVVGNPAHIQPIS